jgi:hypothetical protein
MSCSRLVPVPLLLTALLPAQYHGEAPPVIRSPTPDARFDPARYNAGQLLCLSIIPEQRGSVLDDYLAFAHSVNGAPSRIGAARRDRATNGISALTDFDAITRTGDDWVQVLDTTVGVVGNNGVYSLLLRGSGSGSWNQRRVITGLPVGFRKPALYLRQGALHLIGCTPTTVWDYEINPFAIISNGTSFTPTLGGPGNDLECVVPIVDPEPAGGYWHGILLLENQASRSGGQVVHHSPALAGFFAAENLRPVMNTADDSSSFTKYQGGEFCGIRRASGVAHTVETFISGDRRVPAHGGVILGAALPKRQPNAQEAIVALVLSTQASGPIAVPGFANALGLELGLLILLGAQSIPNSVETAQFSFVFPQLPPGSRFAVQFALLWLLAPNYFSNNSQVLV